jgi:anti-anti-sigma factor
MAYAYRMPEDLDAGMMSTLKPKLEELAALKDDLVLDLKDVQFIDSSGIGGIVFLYKRIVASGHKLSVINANNQPLQLLTHLRLFDLLVKK